MEVSAPNDSPTAQTELDERTAQTKNTLWIVLGRLYRWRWFITGITTFVAVAAVVISLSLPNYYTASTRLLLPSNASGTSMLGQISEGLPNVAQSFLGSGGGDYVRLLALLDSDTMFQSVVKHFKLVEVYETASSKTPRQNAIGQLRSNTKFTVDEKYDYLSVQVMDQDAQRAAQMANYFVERLNHMNTRLASKSAGNYRRFVEARYRKTEAQLDSVLDATTAFQEKHGVMNLEEQAPTFYENVAQIRFNAIQAEIKYKRLRSEYGSGNSAVQAAQEAMQAANDSYEQALQGGEKLMPVQQSDMPAVMRQYVELEKRRRILTGILEYMRPLYEQARFDEERQRQAVQVIDEAVPPKKDSWPPRAIICIMATLSAFVLAVLFVLLYEWWRRRHAYFAQRLQTAVERDT